MGSRKDVTYLIAENLDSLHIKYRGQDRRPVTITDITDEEAAFDLSDYFIARYDKSRILRIYKHISVLAYEQSDLYISKIISIIAYAHYQGLLSCSYARTIRATLTSVFQCAVDIQCRTEVWEKSYICATVKICTK